MKFSEAIAECRKGKRIARDLWGDGWFVCFMPGFTVPAAMVNVRTRAHIPEGSALEVRECFVFARYDQETNSTVWRVGWQDGVADGMADDWRVL